MQLHHASQSYRLHKCVTCQSSDDVLGAPWALGRSAGHRRWHPRPQRFASAPAGVNWVQTCRNMSKHVETKGWELGDLGDWSCELSRLSQDQLIIWAWEWLGDGNGTSRSLCGSKNALDSCFNKTFFADFNSKTSSIFRSGKVIWHNMTIYWRDKCRPLATYGHRYYWCQFLWNVPLAQPPLAGRMNGRLSQSLSHTCTYLLEFFP